MNANASTYSICRRQRISAAPGPRSSSIKYEFKDQRANVPTSGYSGTELYLGETADKQILAIFCFKDRDDVPSPECWRELELTKGVTLTYRFKRPYLAEWRKIDDEVRSFVMGLQAK